MMYQLKLMKPWWHWHQVHSIHSGVRVSPNLTGKLIGLFPCQSRTDWLRASRMTENNIAFGTWAVHIRRGSSLRDSSHSAVLVPARGHTTGLGAQILGVEQAHCAHCARCSYFDKIILNSVSASLFSLSIGRTIPSKCSRARSAARQIRQRRCGQRRQQRRGGHGHKCALVLNVQRRTWRSRGCCRSIVSTRMRSRTRRVVGTFFLRHHHCRR